MFWDIFTKNDMFNKIFFMKKLNKEIGKITNFMNFILKKNDEIWFKKSDS